ncbi:MAG TPA: AAA family ATPase [Candidatus Nanopelagicales bacterium]
MGPWPPPLPRRWSGRSLPPLVGRQRQFDVLEEVWAAVERGARQVVFVGGEAGAGKSRLVAEAAAMLHRHGVPVLFGACLADLGRPYDPFVEPVATLLPALELDRLGAEPDQPPASREARLRMLRLITDSPGPPGSTPPVVLQPALFNAVTGALVAAAGELPMVVVLEDLHWAGEGALALLRFTVERTPDVPLLFLVTVRTAPPDLSPHVGGLIADLMRLDGVCRLDLPGLTTQEIVEYLGRAGPLPEPAARHAASLLRDLTAGNPFLLGEAFREHASALAAGILPVTSVRAPETVRELVRARLERLAPVERAVLETAAVIGEEYELRLLAHAVPGGDPLQGPAPSSRPIDLVFAALEAGRAVGMVEWLPGNGGLAHFPHAIARQAVLELMSPFDLAAANARVALALEEHYPSAEGRVQRLAHHFSDAAVLGYAEQATEYLTAAADAARARSSHADAAELYQRAAAHALDPFSRDELRLASGSAYLRATWLRRARDLAEAVGTSGSPSQRLRAATLFEAASWRSNAQGPRSVTLLTSALAQAGDGPPDRDRILATAALARTLAFSERAGDAAVQRDRALQWARDHDDPALLAEVLTLRLFDPTPELRDGRLRCCEEIVRLARGRDEVDVLGPTAFFRCLGHYELGHPDALAHAYRDLARVAGATSEPYWTLALDFVTFSLQLMRGELAAAARSLAESTRRVAALAEAADASEGSLALQTFILRRETGRLAAVRPLITGEEDPADQWAPGLLALYTEFGMREPARRTLRWILDGDLDSRRRSASWPATLTFLVEAAVALEDRGAACVLLPLAAEHGGHNLVAGEFLIPFGSGDRLVGALESLLGDPTAEEQFATALAMDQRMGSPLHQAATLAEYLQHVVRAGNDRGGAAALAAEAAALSQAHGLVRLTQRIERLWPSGPAQVAPARLTSRLTSRETQVLGLLGRGCSNREIARTLVISEHTAANHVRSILAKLGCANRTQAAMLAVEQDLTTPTR